MYIIYNSSFYKYKIKGSTFISHIFKVNHLKMFKKNFLKIKNQYSDSTHVCYGYRIQSKNTNLFNELDIIEYYNDDGEPSGSSGKQILNTLKRNDIVNCVIFIVRYYGGTKLGIPGLIDAYKIGSVEVIKQSILNEYIPKKTISIKFNYGVNKAVDLIIKKFKCKILNNDFSDVITMELEVFLKDYNVVKKELIEKTKGTILFNE